MRQEEGRKSRCRLVTTMMNRSSHMPSWTTSEITNNAATFRRTRDDQRKVRGIRMFEEMRSQYQKAYGPLMRFTIMVRS